MEDLQYGGGQRLLIRQTDYLGMELHRGPGPRPQDSGAEGRISLHSGGVSLLFFLDRVTLGYQDFQGLLALKDKKENP